LASVVRPAAERLDVDGVVGQQRDERVHPVRAILHRAVEAVYRLVQ
jgi:hypothetical protein